MASDLSSPSGCLCAPLCQTHKQTYFRQCMSPPQAVITFKYYYRLILFKPYYAIPHIQWQCFWTTVSNNVLINYTLYSLKQSLGSRKHCSCLLVVLNKSFSPSMPLNNAGLASRGQLKYARLQVSEGTGEWRWDIMRYLSQSPAEMDKMIRGVIFLNHMVFMFKFYNN